MRKEENAYQSWLWGEILLFGLLGATLALFATYPGLRPTFELPQVRLVLDTMVALAAVLVAVLAGVRFSVDGRRLDWLLCAGFSLAAGSTFCFGIAPVLGGQALHRREQWAWIAGGLLAGALIAAASFARRRTIARRRELMELLVIVPAALFLIWMFVDSFGSALPSLTSSDRIQPPLLTAALAVRALISLVAYAVLLVGVWRAIRYAEFGRAVAEERARVAREIHDGLAQYLFAISTHASMLES